jgi:lactoylglutathione lyase
VTLAIEHVALWTRDLERARAFYVDVLGGATGARYVNARTGFASYFVRFASGARLELMTRGDVHGEPAELRTGWAHVAFRVGSREAVDALVARLSAQGIVVLGAPRTTGDGYYEAVVADPDGNRVELVA